MIPTELEKNQPPTDNSQQNDGIATYILVLGILLIQSTEH